MSARIDQVRKGFPAFADRDLEGLQALMTQDVEIRLASPGRVGKPALMRQSSYSGYSGLRQWIHEIDEDYTDLSLEARELEETGDAVLVLGTLAYDCGGMTVGWVCRFEGDLVSRLEMYWDWSEARAAARQPRAETARRA